MGEARRQGEDFRSNTRSVVLLESPTIYQHAPAIRRAETHLNFTICNLLHQPLGRIRLHRLLLRRLIWCTARVVARRARRIQHLVTARNRHLSGSYSSSISGNLATHQPGIHTRSYTVDRRHTQTRSRRGRVWVRFASTAPDIRMGLDFLHLRSSSSPQLKILDQPAGQVIRDTRPVPSFGGINATRICCELPELVESFVRRLCSLALVSIRSGSKCRVGLASALRAKDGVLNADIASGRLDVVGGEATADEAIDVVVRSLVRKAV